MEMLRRALEGIKRRREEEKLEREEREKGEGRGRRWLLGRLRRLGLRLSRRRSRFGVGGRWDGMG